MSLLAPWTTYQYNLIDILIFPSDVFLQQPIPSQILQQIPIFVLCTVTLCKCFGLGNFPAHFESPITVMRFTSLNIITDLRLCVVTSQVCCWDQLWLKSVPFRHNNNPIEPSRSLHRAAIPTSQVLHI